MTGKVDELELMKPQLPIKTIPRNPDLGQIERWAERVVRIIGAHRMGPAMVMGVMEADPFCRAIPEEYHEDVARRALRLRETEGSSPKRTESEVKIERMREYLRAALTQDPRMELSEAYAGLPAGERQGLSESSFSTTYFFPLRKQLREGGEIPDPGVSGVAISDENQKGPGSPAPEVSSRSQPETERVAPASDERSSPDPQVTAEAPEGEEAEEGERSEAPPSPGVVANGDEHGAQIHLSGQRGSLKVHENSEGYVVDLFLRRTDRETVHALVDALYPQLTGLGGPAS